MTVAPIRRLRGVERMYLALESRSTPMHFGALVVLDERPLLDADGRLPLARVRRRLADRLRCLPELRQVVRRAGPLAGGPIWVEDQAFRVERHVDEVRLPPADAAAGDAGLFAFAEGHLLATLLDRHRPLWRLWFITGLPRGRVAVLVVVHHALTDGLGAMRLLGALLAEEKPFAPQVAQAATPAMPRWRDLVADHWRSLPRQAAVLFRPAAWAALADLVRTFRAGMRVTRREPATSLNVPTGARRRLVVRRLDLRTVKRLAHALDVGANDVVLGLVGSGVRTILEQRDELVTHLAPRVGLAVTLPPSERRDAGNHFGGYIVPLPIAVADPAERIRAAAAARATAKRTQGVSQVTGVRVWTARLRPTRALMARQRVVNLMETFIPGPPRPIALLGAPVLELVPIQPLGRNVALTFLAATYAGCLDLVVRVDPDAVPELDDALAAVDADWRSLTDRLEAGTLDAR